MNTISTTHYLEECRREMLDKFVSLNTAPGGIARHTAFMEIAARYGSHYRTAVAKLCEEGLLVINLPFFKLTEAGYRAAHNLDS